MLIQLQTNTKKQIHLLYNTCRLVASMLLYDAHLPLLHLDAVQRTNHTSGIQLL